MGVFNGSELRDYLNQRRNQAVTAADRVPEDQLRFSVDAVVEQIIATYDIADLQIGGQSEVTVVSEGIEEVKIPIRSLNGMEHTRGQRVVLRIPFRGASELLTMSPSNGWYKMFPHVIDQTALNGDHLTLTIAGNVLTADGIHKTRDEALQHLSDAAEWANNDLARWRPILHTSVATTASNRLNRLDAAAAVLADLAIPIHNVEKGTEIPVAPVQRRTLRIENAAVGGASASAEPKLADAVYEDVVRTISGMTRAMERTPTAAKLQEEELRNLILIVLNANYEGAARGEVFNGAGKTDILLTWNDRNVFIGECKIWSGSKNFGEAIDQLLSYLVWRDTKAALVIFIHNKDTTAVVDKAHATLEEHGNWRTTRAGGTVERRDYLFASRDDPQRMIAIALLPVVLPQTH